MKHRLAIVLMFAGAVSLRAQSTNLPIHEIVINTWPTNALSVAQVKIRSGAVLFDSETWKPIVRVNIEIWSEEVDNGATNIVHSRTIERKLTDAQLTAWRNAQDGKVWLKNAALLIAKTTEKQ